MRYQQISDHEFCFSAYLGEDQLELILDLVQEIYSQRWLRLRELQRGRFPPLLDRESLATFVVLKAPVGIAVLNRLYINGVTCPILIKGFQYGSFTINIGYCEVELLRKILESFMHSKGMRKAS